MKVKRHGRKAGERNQTQRTHWVNAAQVSRLKAAAFKTLYTSWANAAQF